MNPLNYLRKDIFKDLSFLMGGTLIAQLIPILLQPVLKRLFTVEEFGIFDIYFRSVGLLAIVFSLKYEKAIILSKTNRDAASIYAGILLLGTVSFLITELVLIALSSLGIEFKGIPESHSWIVYLIPLSALFFTINLSSQLMFIRQKRFMASSSLKIFRRGSEGLIQTGAGFAGKFAGLPLGESAGSFTAALTGFLRLRKDLRKNLPVNLLRSIKENAEKYAEFPKYAFASSLLNTFVLSALTFQIFAKFSLQEVGYAELTQRMLAVPSALIGVSLGQIILQRISAAFNNSASVIKLFVGFLLFGILIAIPFFVTIYFWGPEIFGFVFGKEWTLSGVYAKYLVSSSAFLIFISPMGQILIGLHKIKTNSIWELGKFLIIVSLFLINFETITSYLKVYNLLLIFIYLSYLIIILWNIRNYEKAIS
ncbi:MAG: oligosaccharide flippase family protein [Bacteroidales bacterium]|nr:oligosaccharide flippase family protein [Bacteroidales bacterium]